MENIYSAILPLVTDVIIRWQQLPKNKDMCFKFCCSTSESQSQKQTLEVFSFVIDSLTL